MPLRVDPVARQVVGHDLADVLREQVRALVSHLAIVPRHGYRQRAPLARR